MAGFGILGGTFDPIHYGHLFLAEQSRETFGLSKVIFVPASLPPHKIGEVSLSIEERLKMVEMATETHPQFQVSKVELTRDGPSYSIDTIRALKSENPGQDCFFILGFDSLLSLNTWKDYQQILEEAQIIAAMRPGFSQFASDRDWPDFLKQYRHRIGILKAPLIDISATWLRNELKSGRSIRYLVPDRVFEYINRMHLYSI
jgi:nicotinate-nucleotide adenylyltransferase